MKLPMTLEDLTKLRNFGYKELPELTLIQHFEYAILLQKRSQEVVEHIMELMKELMKEDEKIS